MYSKNALEIVPGKAIGELRLGARAEEIPKRAKVAGDDGELDGVSFEVVDGRLDDIWIDDLRKSRSEVRIAGRVIPKDAPLVDLKEMLGPCQRVDG